ncbi:MAG TPA: hypothetical protein VMS38_35655, partial [Pseudorhodoferax sp.]|nr:hypothetical protein [Pseudorhodoferax sp.]
LAVFIDPPSQYLEGGDDDEDLVAFDDRLNLFIAARDNYFFPVHFGINDHVAEIAVRMAEQGRALGFRPIAGVAKKGMTFDLWYRPGVIVYPQYEAYGDQWISKSLSVALGTPALCGADTVSGHVKLDLMFPMVAEAPDFRPPFHVQLVDERDQVVARSLVAAAGRQAVELALRNVGCGSYRVVFDQQFSTAADPRRLSALLQGHASALRFDSLR